MDNRRGSSTLTRPTDGTLTLQPGQEAQEMMELGWEHGWPFRFLGNAPLPSSVVRAGDWLISPIYLDSSPIPDRAIQRARTLYQAGARPKGLVLVHEAPPLLSPPVEPTHAPEDAQAASGVSNPHVVGAVDVLAKVLAGLALVALAPLALLVGAVALDPVLVAVTEDGDWVEVDRWNA